MKNRNTMLKQTKIKLSFVLPEAMQGELHKQVIEDGYGMRGKSKWIVEAVQSLLQLNNYPELVKLSEELKGFEKQETITVERDLKSSLDAATIKIRKIYPVIEGVQSHIIRTSIMQRLLKS